MSSRSVPSQTPPSAPAASACVGCRKLKIKCEGAEDPPCKRCRLNDVECQFVESRRGKRPPKRAEAEMTERIKSIEDALAMVLESGQQPTLDVIQELQKTLRDGVTSHEASSQAAGQDAESKRARDAVPAPEIHSPASPPPAEGPAKRSRRVSNPPVAPPSGPSSLSLLADASLVAEIGGRKSITGLDASFRISSVTSALGGTDTASADKAAGLVVPSVLSKGIITPETAIDLFKLFFESPHFRLPLLDPSTSTALAICHKSPFLFTAVLAVASRTCFSPEIQSQIYAEAHTAFIELLVAEDRTLETVQGCLLLTAWGAPTLPGGPEERPKRAWMFFGTAVRLALELGLFRPAAFVDTYLTKEGVMGQADPWALLGDDVNEEEQRDAINRERTWITMYIMDRNISSVMGRPYQIQDARPHLIPLHPMSLPTDTILLAQWELQAHVGSFMDIFRDRMYGLASESDKMPDPVVMKLFNSKLDEWKHKWHPRLEKLVAIHLMSFFHAAKLFLNTFPLQSLLRAKSTTRRRTTAATENTECIAMTISAAKSLLDLAHEYSTVNLLRYVPDVNILFIFHSSVFLLKMRASDQHFVNLITTNELEALLLRAIADCGEAACSPSPSALRCSAMLRALYDSAFEPTALGPVSAHSHLISGSPSHHFANPYTSRSPSFDGNLGGPTLSPALDTSSYCFPSPSLSADAHTPMGRAANAVPQHAEEDGSHDTGFFDFMLSGPYAF